MYRIKTGEYSYIGDEDWAVEYFFSDMVDLTDPIQVSSLAGVVLTIVVVALAILLKRDDLISLLLHYVRSWGLRENI